MFFCPDNKNTYLLTLPPNMLAKHLNILNRAHVKNYYQDLKENQLVFQQNKIKSFNAGL